MTKLNFDAWCEQRRADRRQKLNATCPHCDTNLLKELESAATSGEDTQNLYVLVNCPACEAEIEFRVCWTIEIYSAEIVSTTALEEEA